MSDVEDRASLVESRDDAGVRVITLNRPHRHNALVPELLTAVRRALADAEGEGASCIVLRAAGPSFSTGGDVAEFASREGSDLLAFAGEIVGELNETILDILTLPVPVVTSLHGPVTGGSLGLVLASDVSVAGPQAWVQPFYTEVGFSPDGGWTALLPALVGRARASAWQMNNTRITAEEAVAAGMLTEFHPNPQTRALALARGIAGRRSGALRRTKQLLWDVPGVRAALEQERAEFLDQIVTEEARRGMASFLGAGTPQHERGERRRDEDS